MKKKKNIKEEKSELDPELIRMYMMGAANPAFSNKFETSVDVVDLHIEKSKIGREKIPAQDVIFHQLEQFEKALDTAVAAGKMELRVIHGLGKGKLKNEICKILDKHPHVTSYNDYHSQYGFGSTIIHFY